MDRRPRKPKILFVGAFPTPGRPIYGGVASSCSALIRSSIVSIVDFDLLDSTQISNPPPRLPVRGALAGRRLARFVARLIWSRPDAVLLFSSSGASLVEKGVMGWIARLSGIPVLHFPRAGRVIDDAVRSANSRWFTRVLLNSATVLLCQTQKWQQFAVDTLKFDIKRTIIVENWTASRDFLRVGEQRVGRVSNAGTIRLTFIGWLEREKGIHELISACEVLFKDFDFILQLVGDGHARREAQAHVEGLQHKDRIKFLGWQPPEKLPEILAETDLFVLASWAEGLPNAMIEAMAAKVPVVVSRVGGIPDVINDGVNGFLFEPRSITALVDRLRHVLSSPELCDLVASNGYQTARNRFSEIAAVAGFRVAIATALARDI